MIEAILTGLITLTTWQGLTTPYEPLDLPPIAERIAWCESRGVLTAENPISSASGKYQFIDSTWRAVTGLEPPASAYDERTQDEAFLQLFNGGAGAFHWNASRGCWG